MQILYCGLWAVVLLSVIGIGYTLYGSSKHKGDGIMPVKLLLIWFAVLIISGIGTAVTKNTMDSNFRTGAKQYVLNSVAYYAHQTDGAPESQLKHNYSELIKNYDKLRFNNSGKYSTKIYDQDIKNAKVVHSLNGDYFKNGNVRKLIRYNGSIQKLIKGYENKFGDPTK